MELPFEGRCACGAIHYRVTAAPTFSWLCHCRDCQRASGSGYCAIMYIPQEAVTVTGEATYYTVSAESGNAVSRGFCPTCGSQMFIKAELVPELHGVWAGSMDQPAEFTPVVQVWVNSAQPWGALHPTLPQLPKAPDETEFAQILEAAAHGR